MFGNTFLFAKLCSLELSTVSFWCTQRSWLSVKYQLTNWLFIHSERRLDQTCAGFSDHCMNGTTCDPDTNLCTAVNSKCYLYVTPGVLSTPSLFLSDSVSLTSASFSFARPYLFWHFVQLLQPLCLLYPSFSRTRSGVPQMRKSRSPVLRTQRCGRYILFKSDSATYSFISLFSIYTASLSNSHFLLKINWHKSRPLDRFIVSLWDTVDAEIKVTSVKNPEMFTL